MHSFFIILSTKNKFLILIYYVFLCFSPQPVGLKCILHKFYGLTAALVYMLCTNYQQQMFRYYINAHRSVLKKILSGRNLGFETVRDVLDSVLEQTTLKFLNNYMEGHQHFSTRGTQILNPRIIPIISDFYWFISSNNSPSFNSIAQILSSNGLILTF